VLFASPGAQTVSISDLQDASKQASVTVQVTAEARSSSGGCSSAEGTGPSTLLGFALMAALKRRRRAAERFKERRGVSLVAVPEKRPQTVWRALPLILVAALACGPSTGTKADAGGNGNARAVRSVTVTPGHLQLDRGAFVRFTALVDADRGIDTGVDWQTPS